MKCKRCKAAVVESYPESIEQSFYCLCGIEDDERIEKADGELGCTLHYTEVNRRCQGTGKGQT